MLRISDLQICKVVMMIEHFLSMNMRGPFHILHLNVISASRHSIWVMIFDDRTCIYTVVIWMLPAL